MNRQNTGAFLVARSIYDSVLWKRPPQYARLFFLLVGKAVFQDGHIFKGHVLRRGELITTYAEMSEALSYTFNRATIKPSIKELRIMLSWMMSEGMISVKPFIDGTSPNKGRPTELTRAYAGLLVCVINYDSYQDFESYKGRDKGRPSFEQGQLEEECKKNKKIYTSDSIEYGLADFLLQKILSRNSGFKKPNVQQWARDIDLMIRLDHRRTEDIRRVVEWCQSDQFWRKNILSPKKLREKYDQLREHMPEVKASSW